MALVLRGPSGLTVLCLCSSNVAYFGRLGMTESTPGMSFHSHTQKCILSSVYRWSTTAKKYGIPTLQFSASASFFFFSRKQFSTHTFCSNSHFTLSLSLAALSSDLRMIFLGFPSQGDWFQETEGFCQAKIAQRSICERNMQGKHYYLGTNANISQNTNCFPKKYNFIFNK